MPRRVWIFDTTLRDGEQVPGASLRLREKVEIAHQLARLGVDVIEAGFPISSPGDFEAVRTIAREVKGRVITGLARAVQGDIECLYEAVKDAEAPRLHIFLGSSDIHIEKKFRKDREQVLEQGVSAVKFGKKLCSEIEYSTEDASRTDFDYLCRTLEAVIDAGATVVNIPDTVGYAYPTQWFELITKIRERVPNIHKAKISVHCHNDLGLATANSLAAVLAGADQVECTINGIGERAGNASMEEIVMAMKTRKDIFSDVEVNINTTEFMRTSKLVSTLMGIPVQPNKAIVGSNAFAHSSGIHQDGILKDRSTYEIMRPESVGVTEHKFVLTARSGRHALKHRLHELGYTVEEGPKFDKIYERFIMIADRKKQVYDADLETIMKDQISAGEGEFDLEAIEVVSGTNAVPTARVRLVKGDQRFEDSGTGDGPVDAAFKTIDKVTGARVELADFAVRAVTKGREALGEATVVVKADGQAFTGRGSSTDIIEASARAYVDAINKVFGAEQRNLAAAEARMAV
ncbi:MAG TPA: 2-isopropylmalate synthase [Thermodesulfobacteriota bacterium]